MLDGPMDLVDCKLVVARRSKRHSWRKGSDKLSDYDARESRGEQASPRSPKSWGSGPLRKWKESYYNTQKRARERNPPNHPPTQQRINAGRFGSERKQAALALITLALTPLVPQYSLRPVSAGANLSSLRLDLLELLLRLRSYPGVSLRVALDCLL